MSTACDQLKLTEKHGAQFRLYHMDYCICLNPYNCFARLVMEKKEQNHTKIVWMANKFFAYDEEGENDE